MTPVSRQTLERAKLLGIDPKDYPLGEHNPEFTSDVTTEFHQRERAKRPIKVWVPPK